MYRQYENPRELEKRLADLKTEYESALKQGKMDVEEQHDMFLEIADLEERVNFAWQDEEYDEANV